MIAGFNITSFKGHENNFDFIRFVSACFVIITHSYVLLGMSVGDDILMKLSDSSIMLSTLGLKCFFIISGFLISASVSSTPTYYEYIWKRSLRIFPGLIVVILLSTFVMGPLLTSETGSEYFKNFQTWNYLKNIFLFKIYYQLPGVFQNNPEKTVNGSIWTLIYEFLMYIGVVVLHFFGAFKKRVWILILFFLLLSFRVFTEYHVLSNKVLWFLPYTDLYLPHTIDFSLYFAAGMVIYSFRKDILFSNILFWIVLVVWISSFYLKLFFVLHYLCIPYLLFYLAYHPRFKSFNGFAKHGDFSYGMYLYAMPVQQMIIFFLGISISVELFICLSIALTLPFAIFSWHLVESKALRLKNIFQKKSMTRGSSITA